MPMIIQEVMIDCQHPAELAKFWADLMNRRRGIINDGLAVVDSDPVRLSFQQVPESKQVKNRLHLDIQVPDADAAAEQAIALGAQATGHLQLDDGGDGYLVMLDPEGNEFCFVVDNSGEWDQRTNEALANSTVQPDAR